MSGWQFEDQYLDVLQNIEAVIVGVYHDQPELTDHNVDKALSSLVRVYQARLKEQSAPPLSFKPLEQQVYDAVKAICEWRMGNHESASDEEIEAIPPKTLDEIIACLKRIRKSINLWTRQGGRQGYLTYVTQFLSD